MDVKASVHGGFRMPLIDHLHNKNHGDLVFAFNYMAQGTFDQMDLGASTTTRSH